MEYTSLSIFQITPFTLLFILGTVILLYFMDLSYVVRFNITLIPIMYSPYTLRRYNVLSFVPCSQLPKKDLSSLCLRIGYVVMCWCFLLMVIYYHGLFYLSIYFLKKVLFFYKLLLSCKLYIFI